MKIAIHTAGVSASRSLRLRNIEHIALAVGLTLIAIWAAAQIHRFAISRAAMARFSAQNTDVTSGSIDPVVGSPVDFRLWSTNRIAVYKHSLIQKTDMPQGILHIAKIHLDAPVFDGTDDLTLNRGLGRISGTARIGELGNVGIAGHRDGFFRGLKDIRVGDLVELELPGRTNQYVVTKIQVVKPENIQVLRQTPTATLTLVTCFPFYFVGSAPDRYIVTASIRNSSRPELTTSPAKLGPDRQEHSIKNTQ
jgi:sortase A